MRVLFIHIYIYIEYKLRASTIDLAVGPRFFYSFYADYSKVPTKNYGGIFFFPVYLEFFVNRAQIMRNSYTNVDRLWRGSRSLQYYISLVKKNVM